MAMASPTCVATNSFERKPSLLVRRGGSCQPRYVQKCTEEGSRASCVLGSSDGGTDQSTCAHTRDTICHSSQCTWSPALRMGCSELQHCRLPQMKLFPGT